jgi:Apea-like HEPN
VSPAGHILGRMEHVPDDLRAEVGEPFVYTFTAHLSFVLGIPDGLGHSLWLHAPWADAADAARFGERPFINIRVFTAMTPGLPAWPSGTHRALKRFYGYQLEADPDSRYGEESLTAHDQWISLETPSALVAGESAEEDPAYAFHRCLGAFNLFLQGVLVATKDIRIRPVTSYDLRPIVIIGALVPRKGWRLLTEMFMHPEARAEPLPMDDAPITQDQLNAGMSAIFTQLPYVTTILWRSRAQRALNQTGDPADAIISFQVAAESLLFDTYRMLLIDERLSSTDLEEELEKELPFKSLVVRIMPSKLGGRWDVTQENTAIGAYWKNLYLVRNSIIHTGMQPHGGHAERAQKAYWSLRDHLEERLLANLNTYPRTALARFTTQGLEERGHLTTAMRRFAEEAASEPGPWYWPYDTAGRDRNSPN